LRNGSQDAAERLIAEGNAAENEGRVAEACEHYREAVRVAPLNAKAHLNLGIGLEASGRLDEAAANYETALRLDPSNPYVHYNLGKLLFTRGSMEQATCHLLSALDQRPAFPEACIVLASVLDAQRDFAGAAQWLERALEHAPGLAGGWHNYGLALVKLDRLGEAEAAARRAIQLDEAFLPAYRLLADVLRNDGRHEEAAEVYGKACSLAGGGLEYEQARLHALNHSDHIGEAVLFEQHKAVGARLEAAHPPRFGPFANQRDPERRLRIGYVSRDFRQHPVAWFLMPVLEKHDRSRFEVHCYSRGEVADDMTAQARARADHWHDASRLSHQQAADLVHRHGIDVLIDLLGHCLDSDLALFAQRPAPVQASWLGYLNTTGLTQIEYRITDSVSDPRDLADRLHTETLVRLPDTQWCYRPWTAREHGATAPFQRNGFVTFGSFNHMLKLSRSVRDLWKAILKQVPDARLVLLGVPTGPARDALVREFLDAGISVSRLTAVAPLPLNEYLAWFDSVDIALDPFPYSGGTTTCDTLWMGVPVLTLPGARSASRSAASILSCLGLSEWIARSPEEYVGLAVRYARQPEHFQGLRASLRLKMKGSPLMDEGRFVRELEASYRGMWRAWCAVKR
jgi:predicted O-linked N-acetylglucosamine transferase (SPINDLY family)